MNQNNSPHPSGLRMKRTRVLSAAVFLGLLTVAAQAQTITRVGDGVQAFFASQGNGYQASDPLFGPFGAALVGPYSVGLVLPTLPAAPTASLTPASGNPFAGVSYTSIFNDGQPLASVAMAQSTIDDFISGTPTFTSDVRISIPGWRLFQAAGASLWAYEQINFGSNYLITLNPGLLASTPSLPVFINGSVVAGGGAYVQFDGVIDYTWLPVTLNTAGTITASGPAAPLGQLAYTFLQSGGGTFSTTLLSTGGLLATPAGDGVLALNGHMWLAGDPFEANVSTVPEPASMVLLVAGAVLVAGRQRAGARR